MLRDPQLFESLNFASHLACEGARCQSIQLLERRADGNVLWVLLALISLFPLTLLTASRRVQHRFPARQGTKPHRDWLRDLYGVGRFIIQGKGNPRVKQILKFKWSRGKLHSHRAAHSLQLHTKNSPLARESMEESGCPKLCGFYLGS